MADSIPWIADQIERRPTEALIPYARNSRLHSPESVAKLAAGMREWGWTVPCLIDEDDGIIAGHGRVMAAQKLKLAEVPVIVARGWSEERKRAYVIWDNKSSELSTFDQGILKIELADLQGSGFDLSLTGFSSLELTSIFATQEGNTDPDDAPEPPATPTSQAGDLWRLGEHLLICGDSTDKATVERVLAGQTPHLMITDPPFGVDYSPEWRTLALKDGGKRAEGQVRNDDRADWREAWALFPGDVAYVWHADKGSSAVEASLHACGFETRNLIIWNKSQLVVGRGHYHSKHEAAWYMVRKGANGHWSGDRKQTTVWDIEHRKSETGHGTQKPVEAMARPIRNNSQPGDHVYEPFSGSFTTGIACQMNKRIVHAIELDPRYVDLGVRRWENFTGQKASLDGDGRTFDEIAAERLEVV